MKFGVTVFVAAGCLGLAHRAAAQPGARDVSFAEAERTALANNVEVKIADEGLVAAKRGTKSTKALRLPKLSVDSNVLLWDKELAFDFAIPGMPAAPGSSVVVRDRVTSTTSVTLAQPLSSQLVIKDMVALSRQGVAAAKVDRQRARLDVAYHAADAYVSVLLAQSSTALATERIKQLNAQLERVKILVQGGVRQRVDVLRLESALAKARADQVRGATSVRLAQGLLAVAMGVPASTRINVKDTFPASPGPPRSTYDNAIAMAENKRPEMRSVHIQRRQAELAAQVEKSKLYPNITAIGTLQHNEGQGSFQPKNAWFVGITLQWDVWDWGGQWNSYKQARARARAAALAKLRVRDGIRIEVGAQMLAAQSSHKLLAVTNTGVKAAAEAYRIEKDRYQAGAVTTTELLDAEAELAKAKLAYTSARYSYFRELIKLAKATGRLPTTLFKGL